MEEIVIDNEGLMETTANTNAVAGQVLYDFPADLSVLRSIQYQGFALKNLSFNEFNQYLDGYSSTLSSPVVGTPQVFMVWDNQIRVFPVPSASVTAGLTIYYMRHPVQVATVADIPEVPVQYHKAIVDFCLQQAYELDEDTAKQQVKGADFLNKMMKLNDRNKATQEYYPSITTLPEDDMDNYNNGYMGGY